MSPTHVLSGLDVIARRLSGLLRGQRLGLLCHQASVTRDLRHAIDVIGDMRGVTLTSLFAPEHGLAGTTQDQVLIGTTRHRASGLPVWSLYGRRLSPDPRMLAGLDTVVVDLQDVGSRYYTFVWTTALVMQASARAGVRVVVLDRPNPIGGERVEGNMPDPRFASFVGLYPLPARHGMTLAELAAYLNEAHGLGCDLTVVPMSGWRRRMAWADTGLPWVAPSPNMPTVETALVYPGGCLVEGTNLSEGRGTTRPFELVGAPFLDGVRLARALEGRGLPGVVFRAAGFEPTFHKWAGKTCEGVQVHVTEPRRFRPFLTYLTLIAEARRQSPSRFGWRRTPYEFETRRLAMDLLCGGPGIRRAIENRAPLRRLETSWSRGLAGFARARRPFLLYD